MKLSVLKIDKIIAVMLITDNSKLRYLCGSNIFNSYIAVKIHEMNKNTNNS